MCKELRDYDVLPVEYEYFLCDVACGILLEQYRNLIRFSSEFIENLLEWIGS